MKRLILILSLFLLMSCETKYNYIDTGTSNGVHDMSLYEYLKRDSYNWDTTRLMIERAGLVPLFEGKVDTASEITFFGPTNHTIRNWMIDSAYTAVDRIPVELCRELILRHVVAGKYMKMEVPRGTVATSTDAGRTGGVYLTSLADGHLWLYTFHEPYYGIENNGPVVLYLKSVDHEMDISIASTDIQTNTGVVHSLQYGYYFGDL